MHGIYRVPDVYTCFKGFRVAGADPDLQGSCSVTVAFSETPDVEIDVSRNSVKLERQALKEISEFLQKRVAEIETEFLATHQESIYACLNARILGREIASRTRPHWGVFTQNEALEWVNVEPPCVVPEESQGRAVLGSSEHVSPEALTLNGSHVTVCAQLMLGRNEGYQTPIALSLFEYPPDHVVEGPTRNTLLPAWTLFARKSSFPPVALVPFPPNWNVFLGMRAEASGQLHVLLNASHALSVWAHENKFELAGSVLSQPSYARTRKAVFPDESRRSALRQTPALALDWLIACLVSGELPTMWEVLHQQDSSFLPDLWSCLHSSTPPDEIYFYTETSSILGARYIHLTPTKASNYPAAQVRKIIGEAPDEWRLRDNKLPET
jgi:hypothetical protein